MIVCNNNAIYCFIVFTGCRPTPLSARFVPYCIALHRVAVLHCAALYCTVLYCTVMYCIVLHFMFYCISLHCIARYSIVLYCIVFQFDPCCTLLLPCSTLRLLIGALCSRLRPALREWSRELYYTILYYTILYYTILYYTILY